MFSFSVAFPSKSACSLSSGSCVFHAFLVDILMDMLSSWSCVFRGLLVEMQTVCYILIAGFAYGMVGAKAFG